MDGLTESDYTTASSNAQYVLKRRLRTKLPVMHKMLREGAAQSIDVGFGAITEGKSSLYAWASDVSDELSRLERGASVLFADEGVPESQQLHPRRKGPW